jgi:hypothetical protein
VWADSGVSFFISRADLPATLSEEEVETVLGQALAAWRSPECTAVEPIFAGWTDDSAAAQDAVNTIAWVADWHDRDLPASVPGNTDIAYRGKGTSWHIAEASGVWRPSTIARG